MEPSNLQGVDQSDEVQQHLLSGQLHTQDSQQREQSLVVVPPTALLLASEVDVPVETLGVLRTHEHTCARLLQVGNASRSVYDAENAFHLPDE